MAKDLVLPFGDPDRLLLQGDQAALDGEEPDEVARRPDRELLEVEPVGRPVLEGQLPGELQEHGGRLAEADAGERGAHRGSG
jgi:hypothetical protein